MLKSSLKKILFKCIPLLAREDLLALDILVHRRLASNDFSRQMSHAYWEQATGFWNHAPSPIRPSAGDVAIYREFLQERKTKQRILILGSTPELRDLAAQAGGSSVYLADFSSRIPIQMLAFTRHVDPLRETWIKGDWLDLPFPPHFFDVILGDLVLDQLPPEKEAEFLTRLHSLLAHDGALIGRLRFTERPTAEKDIAALVDHTMGIPVGDIQKFLLLRLRLRLLYADPALRQISLGLCMKDFSDYIGKRGDTHVVLDKTRQTLETDITFQRTWCAPDRKALSTLLEHKFRILDTKIATDYEDASTHPIFLLGKR